jgi:putative SOS response-associated peptidase YedK
LVIRRNHQTGVVSLDPLRWGLIPCWCDDPTGGRKPINAKRETVRTLPTFGDAYRRRRCIVPVDGFFEWKAIKGQKSQAALRHRHEGRQSVWPWRAVGKLERPELRRVAPHLCDYHGRLELVADSHNRLLLILPPTDYIRWLSDQPDPHDLLRPFPAEPMRMWPISTRVNKPENDDPSILRPIELSAA